MVKNRPKIAKSDISMLFGALPWQQVMCNLNVIVVLDFISRDLYLIFAIRFSSKFQNSVFYRHMRPKSGLKSPRPLNCILVYLYVHKINWFDKWLTFKHSIYSSSQTTNSSTNHNRPWRGDGQVGMATSRELQIPKSIPCIIPGL